MWRGKKNKTTATKCRARKWGIWLLAKELVCDFLDLTTCNYRGCTCRLQGPPDSHTLHPALLDTPYPPSSQSWVMLGCWKQCWAVVRAGTHPPPRLHSVQWFPNCRPPRAMQSEGPPLWPHGVKESTRGIRGCTGWLVQGCLWVTKTLWNLTGLVAAQHRARAKHHWIHTL